MIRTPRELYEYTDGRIDVRFRHAKYDWLQMQVRAHGRGCRVKYLDEEFRVVGSEWFQGRHQKISCRIASVFCPFGSMIRWLEAMTTDVQSCSFEWEGEGPDGFMGWDRNQLTIRWPAGSDKERVLEVFADRKQVVRAFYTAFRRFVGSPEYHPEDYENLRVGEEIAIAMRGEYPEAEIRGLLIQMNAKQAEETLQRMRPQGRTTAEGTIPGEPGAGEATVQAVIGEHEGDKAAPKLRIETIPYIDSGWDRWTTARRREFLTKVFDRRGNGGLGAPIRELRSEIVERWLGWGWATRG